jgi:hypothetical protein
MIFFSLTLPSRFGEWCDCVTARLVEHALGPVQMIYTDTLDQFALGVMKARSPYLAVCSRQMVGWLWAALAQLDRGFIVALDDPRLALERLVVHHGADFVEATRIVAKSCASMASCAPIPGALVLHARQSEANPVGTAQAIARHLGLGVDEAEIANSVAALAEVGLWPAKEDTAWWDRLEGWQRALVTGAIDPYVARLSGGDLWPITWEKELFFINEEQPQEPGQLASRPVDITGRPRFVVHGPYITLPPGSWSATVVLGFSEEAAELSYIVEIHAERQLAHMRIQPSGQRYVEAILNFSIDAPDMIAVRVLNERAAFEGRLALGNVIMTPHIGMRPETRTYFAAVLSQ